MNILIIEDSNTRIKLFKRNLIGANITVAKNNGEALQYLDRNVYDYIFLDFDANEELTETFEESINWIASNYSDFTDVKFILHSLNDYAKTYINVYRYLGLTIEAIPWAWERCTIENGKLNITSRTYEDN